MNQCSPKSGDRAAHLNLITLLGVFVIDVPCWNVAGTGLVRQSWMWCCGTTLKQL